METIVLIALIIIAAFAVLGFREGVVRRLVEVLGLLATILLTARFAAQATPSVAEATGWAEGPALVGSWAVLIVLGLLASRLLAVVISKSVRLSVLGWLDHLGGAVCGAVVGLLVSSFLLMVLAHVPGGGELYASSQRDPMGRFIAGAAPSLATQAKLLAGDRFSELWRQVSDETAERASDASAAAREKADEAADRAGEAAKDAVVR